MYISKERTLIHTDRRKRPAIIVMLGGGDTREKGQLGGNGKTRSPSAAIITALCFRAKTSFALWYWKRTERCRYSKMAKTS